MILVEAVGDVDGVEIDTTYSPIEKRERNAQQGTDLRGDQTFDFPQALAARDVGAQNGHPFYQNALRDGAAHTHGVLVRSIPITAEHGVELTSIGAVEQNGPAFGGSDLKNQVQEMSLSCVEVADGMHGAADF